MIDRYSRLSESEIDNLLAEYNIEDITSYELLSGGQENTNYLIKSKAGKYVLSICEQKSFESATELAQLLDYLDNSNFNTSKIIRGRANKFISSYRGKPVMLKQFIEGKIVEDLTAELLNAIGRELGKLHQIASPGYLPTELGYGVEQFANVKKYAANSVFDKWLSGIQKMITPYLELGLPKSIIHSDLFWDNVIVSEEEDIVTIMDFEEASFYYRGFDIGMAIIGLCSEEKVINLEKVSCLLEGYQQAVKLQEVEVNALKAFTMYAGASMTYWRYQNFNFVKPDPEKYDHYLGLKVLVDFIAEQEDDCLAKMFKRYY